MNNVTLAGRLGSDIELRTTPQGTNVASVNLAVSDEFSKDITYWIPLVFWRKTAELAAQYLKKGSQIGVVGKLTTNTYMANDGTKRTKFEVVVDRLYFLERREKTRTPDEILNDDYKAVDDDDLPF